MESSSVGGASSNLLFRLLKVSTILNGKTSLSRSITFYTQPRIFTDIPSMCSEPFGERLVYLKKTFGPGETHKSDKVVVVRQEKAGHQHVLDKLKEIDSLGEEGLMLREAGL